MHYTTLISVAELQACLSASNLVLVDCRFSLADTEAGRKAYQSGHIPGAWYAHLDEQLSGVVVKGQTGRHPLPDVEALQHVFSKWSIDAHTQVVVYDDLSGAMAARLWWLLRWMGHEKVAVLDGGWPKWVAAGGVVSIEQPVENPAVFKPVIQPAQWVQAGFVETILHQPEYLLVDSRAPERYRGEVEPIDPVAGHIPGAINLPHFSNIGPDGCFLDKTTLRQKLEAILDEHTPEHTIFYCGSGVTAAHNVLAMEHAGFPGSKIYAGSWSEWITDASHPVAKG